MYKDFLNSDPGPKRAQNRLTKSLTKLNCCKLLKQNSHQKIWPHDKCKISKL